MWGGGGAARWLPKPCPLPQVGGITCKIGGSAVSHHMTCLRVTPSVREWPSKGPRVTCEVSASGPPRSHVTSAVGGGGRKRDFFKYSLINGYLKKPVLQERSANICPYLISMSKSAYLLSMSCEKRISCLYSVGAYINAPERLFFLSRRHYILQATSLQKTVNIKNKAGQNSTRGTVSSLFFSH